jgi:hypothetical protein
MVIVTRSNCHDKINGGIGLIVTTRDLFWLGAATIPGTILHGFGTEEFRENENKVRNPSRVSSLSS